MSVAIARLRAPWWRRVLAWLRWRPINRREVVRGDDGHARFVLAARVRYLDELHKRCECVCHCAAPRVESVWALGSVEPARQFCVNCGKPPRLSVHRNNRIVNTNM